MLAYLSTHFLLSLCFIFQDHFVQKKKKSFKITRFDVFLKLIRRSDHSLRDATFTAYNQVFAPHHGWAIQQAVATGIGSLLPKTLLSGMFNETGT